MPDPPRIDFSCSVFSLHRHLRKSEDDYPKRPFLVADPHRRAAVRGLLDSLGRKPKIGLAWSGGVVQTGADARRTNLETLLPILKQPATFVSLEYRDRSDQIADMAERRGIQIHDFPWLTRADDYDDTAALVAELDMVIAVPTTVVHAAGGLGVPTLCMVHPRPNIHYAAAGDRMPYYGSVELFRRERDRDWVAQVQAVNDRLTQWLVGRQAA